MPRGGRRVGAGRKPTSTRPKGVVLGMDGARRALATALPVPPALETDSALAVPPPDLPDAQQKVWAIYAPHAIQQNTLILATVAGFRELCEQYVLKQEIAAHIQKQGTASRDADAALRHYVKLAQRVDSSLARFKLTSFGKPAHEGGRTPKANPWAAIAK